MARKLRIAFSAVCGIVCLALIVVWVRSYWHIDQFGRNSVGKNSIGFMSIRGHLMVAYTEDPTTIGELKAAGVVDGWYRGELLTEEWINATAGEKQWDPSKLFRGFKFSVSDLRLPYWFLVLMFAVPAAVLWPHWSRRFTLRTLLVGMSALAVLLVLIVWAIK
jgi:hypothetical protein